MSQHIPKCKVVLPESGWPRELFVSTVNDNLKCAICLEVPMVPKRCSDEHLFCEPCIMKWLRRNRTCPVNRALLTASTLSTFRFATAIIEELDVYCLSCTNEPRDEANHCKWTGKLRQLVEHLERCRYVLVICPSDGCTEQVQKCDLNHHLTICGFALRECVGCNKMMKRHKLSAHQLSCGYLIAEIFRQHVTDVGNEKIEQRQGRCDGGESKGEKGEKGDGKEKEKEKKEDKETNDDPEFVKDLLAVHDKFLAVVSKQFCGHALFQKALKDAFVELVNRDVGKFKTADLISSFCDRLLKSGSGEKLNDSELEEFLEKTVQLFSYLSDKDLFAEIYRNQLAKRLLNQRSASDDMERLMIVKLKLRCGAQFTAKMEGMLNDLAIGLEMSQSFEKFCKENPEKTGLGKLDFGVQVLTAGHWPTYKTVEMHLPVLMQRCTQVFKEYYDGKGTMSNRKLNWSFTLGNAVIKGFFAKGRTFDIQVTTLQAVALIAFNGEETTHSFTALLESVGMGEDVLKRVLHSLSCGKFKVLKRISEGGGSSEKGPIKNTDTFQYNEGFTCQMRKIRIPMASLDDTNNIKRVEEDRSIAIEAATVRIMKARKTLSHQQLTAEVLSQLAFFSPNPKTIKKRIEALIDREYLERDPDQPQVYRYLA